MTDTNLYANPYDTSANGFYFKSTEEFAKKSKELVNSSGSPVEEFEIEFIDGDLGDLFYILNISSEQLEIWFDEIEILDDHEHAAMYWLAQARNYTAKQSYDKYEDVNLFEGSLEDWAYNEIEEVHDLPDNLHYYFDFEAYASDVEANGDIAQFDYEGTSYIVLNPQSKF